MSSMLSKIIVGKEKKPFRVMIYGVEGIGKSSFCAMADKPIFIQTEEGLNEIDCAKFPLAKTLDDVLSAIRDLYSEKHDFKTVVLDSADWLEKLIWEKVCEENKVDNIAKVGYGKGYEYAMTHFDTVVNGFEALRIDRGMNILITAHSTIEKFDSPSLDSAIDRFTPRLHKKVSHYLREWADACLFANRKIFTKQITDGMTKKAKGVSQGERVLYTEETHAYMAKNRYGLPPEIALDFNEFKTLIYGESK